MLPTLGSHLTNSHSRGQRGIYRVRELRKGGRGRMEEGWFVLVANLGTLGRKSRHDGMVVSPAIVGVALHHLLLTAH